ncbi:ABC-F family ATP-binding cassette domain-containing protein [Nanoarchaeota archaeon]
MILRIKNLSKKFGSKVLFEDTEFIIHEGDKVVLMGQNGTGKSTLIRCVSGDEPYDGIIEVNKEINLSVMEQEKKFEKEEQNFFNYLEDKRKLIQEKLKKIEEKLADPNIYDNLQEFENVLQAHEMLSSRITEKLEESKVKNILNELGFEMEFYNKRIVDLSGGQKTKLRLAECLAREADFFIFDEPTNHLDFESIEWLENWLIKSKQTILVISHDRYFLKKFVNKFFDIEDKKIKIYHGNYEKYRDEREKHLEILEKDFKDTEKERKRLLDSAKEKRQWAQIKGSRQVKLIADKLEKRAEQIPKVTDPKEINKVFRLDFEEKERPGNMIFSIIDCTKSFDKLNVLKNLNFSIHRREKIAVIGKNGSGKTTLLKMLSGEIDPDKGEINKGINVNVGYFDQELKDMNQNQKVIDFLAQAFPYYAEHNLISIAVKFGFPIDKLKDKIKTLSGGEKARINLVRLMLKKNNVLILDEPTNNLDLELIEKLEEALINYEGTLIFVSHDRYLIDKIATKIIKIEDKIIKLYKGNYSDNFS